jgi:hypothetical protein
MLDCVLLDASLWLSVGFNAHKAIWFSGVVGSHFQRGENMPRACVATLVSQRLNVIQRSRYE